MHSRIVDRVEREVIAQVLHECDGVQIKAASRLGINRNTLHKKLKQYGLDGEVQQRSRCEHAWLSLTRLRVLTDL